MLENRIIFIFTCIALHLNLHAIDYIDKNPSEATKEDLHLMREFDQLSYKLTDSKIKTLHVGKIYSFILQNLKYKISIEKLSINLTGSTGYSNSQYDYETNGVSKKNKYYAKIGIDFDYPIFDEKTEKSRKQEQIKNKNELLIKIEKYASFYNSLQTYQRELSYQRLLQVRAKLQVKSGVKYLDDKLSILEKILDLQSKISDVKTELHVYKNILLNYVHEYQKNELEKLLQ